MTEQLRTAASPRSRPYLVSPGLQPTFIPWQRLWRPIQRKPRLALVLDYRGHGQSEYDRNPHNYTLPVDTRRPLGCDYWKSPNLFW
jgi:hypothetical protein